MRFIFRLPARGYGLRRSSRAFFQLTAVLCLAATILMAVISPSIAQKAGGGNRAVKVEVAEVRTQIIANLIDVQGRMTAGPFEAVTAVTNAITEIGKLQIGDQVRPGDIIAVQDSAKLELRLEQLKSRLREAEVKLKDGKAELAAEGDLLNVAKAQAALLAGKAERAKELVTNNALPVESAETALNASLAADMQVLTRESSIMRKKAQQAVLTVTIEQTETEIKQVIADVKATKLRAKTAGQIIYIADYRRGYSREGEVVAKIINLDGFEVEAEVPVAYLPYVQSTKKFLGRGLDGSLVELAIRVSLPFQNLRSGTRTMRFSLIEKVPTILQADNAVVVMQIPTTSPKPQVIVPKDAVLPVSGGHMVYLADENRAKRQIIQIGAAVKDGFIVLGGLTAGQKVVVRGNEQLSDGKEIQISGGKRKAKAEADNSTENASKESQQKTKQQKGSN